MSDDAVDIQIIRERQDDPTETYEEFLERLKHEEPTGCYTKTMQPDLPARLARAKELLNTTRHAAMATVNPDGSPHNSPFYLMFDDSLRHIYWSSHPDSQHCKNVMRTGQAFVTVYDAMDAKKGGLYFKLERGYVMDGDELKEAIAVNNATRQRDGRPPVDPQHYENGPAKMYRADIVQAWLWMAEYDETGEIKRDFRQPINPSDLL